MPRSVVPVTPSSAVDGEAPGAGEKRICEARRCPRVLPMGMLMCREHWTQVPADLQREIYRLWRSLRQGEAGAVAGYRAAVAAAVTHVSGAGRRRRGGPGDQK